MSGPSFPAVVAGGPWAAPWPRFGRAWAARRLGGAGAPAFLAPVEAAYPALMGLIALWGVWGRAPGHPGAWQPGDAEYAQAWLDAAGWAPREILEGPGAAGPAYAAPLTLVLHGQHPLSEWAWEAACSYQRAQGAARQGAAGERAASSAAEAIAAAAQAAARARWRL